MSIFSQFKSLVNILTLSLVLTFVVACGDKKDETKTEDIGMPQGNYDPVKGEGKFKDITLNPSLDPAMSDKGEKVASVKCYSCHKTTEERLVGPGWKGVTTRRDPAWLMNFFTNPEVMLDKDPALQEQLEVCLVRMPNQNISDDEARNILEFMRKIDGVK